MGNPPQGVPRAPGRTKTASKPPRRRSAPSGSALAVETPRRFSPANSPLSPVPSSPLDGSVPWFVDDVAPVPAPKVGALKGVRGTASTSVVAVKKTVTFAAAAAPPPPSRLSTASASSSSSHASSSSSCVSDLSASGQQLRAAIDRLQAECDDAAMEQDKLEREVAKETALAVRREALHKQEVAARSDRAQRKRNLEARKVQREENKAQHEDKKRRVAARRAQLAKAKAAKQREHKKALEKLQREEERLHAEERTVLDEEKAMLKRLEDVNLKLEVIKEKEAELEELAAAQTTRERALEAQMAQLDDAKMHLQEVKSKRALVLKREERLSKITKTVAKSRAEAAAAYEHEKARIEATIAAEEASLAELEQTLVQKEEELDTKRAQLEDDKAAKTGDLEQRAHDIDAAAAQRMKAMSARKEQAEQKAADDEKEINALLESLQMNKTARDATRQALADLEAEVEDAKASLAAEQEGQHEKRHAVHVLAQELRDAEAEAKMLKKVLERKAVQHEVEMERETKRFERAEAKIAVRRAEVHKQREAHNAKVRSVRAAHKQHEKEERALLEQTRAAYKELERGLRRKEADLAKAEQEIADLEQAWRAEITEQKEELEGMQEQAEARRAELEDEQERLQESLEAGEEAQETLQADLEKMRARLAARRKNYTAEQQQLFADKRMWVENAEGSARARCMEEQAVAFAKLCDEEQITRDLLHKEEEVNVMRSTLKRKADQQCRSTQKISKMLDLFDAEEEDSTCSPTVPAAMGRLTVDALPTITVTPSRGVTPQTTRKRLSYRALEESPCSLLSLASVSPKRYMRPSVQTKTVDKLAMDVGSTTGSIAESAHSSNLSLDKVMKSLPRLPASTGKKRSRRTSFKLEDDDDDCVSQLKFTPVALASDRPAKKARPAAPPVDLTLKRAAAPSPKRTTAKSAVAETKRALAAATAPAKKDKPKANPFAFLRDDVKDLFAVPKKVTRMSVQRLSTGSDDGNTRLNLKGVSKRDLLKCLATDDTASDVTADVRDALGGDDLGGVFGKAKKGGRGARDSIGDLERDILGGAGNGRFATDGGSKRRAAMPFSPGSDATEQLNLGTRAVAAPRVSCLTTPTGRGALRNTNGPRDQRRPKQSVRFDNQVVTKRFSLGSDPGSTLNFNFE